MQRTEVGTPVYQELEQISGQKPILTMAKKSVANFKIREGQNVGMKVTLRGTRMYEFFDKFVSIALPRVRDFRGVSTKSFDGRGNYSMGVKEQLIFPEISYDQVEKVRGLIFVSQLRLTPTKKQENCSQCSACPSLQSKVKGVRKWLKKQ